MSGSSYKATGLLCQSLLFNNMIKKETQAQVFSCEFCDEDVRWLLLLIRWNLLNIRSEIWRRYLMVKNSIAQRSAQSF